MVSRMVGNVVHPFGNGRYKFPGRFSGGSRRIGRNRRNVHSWTGSGGKIGVLKMVVREAVGLLTGIVVLAGLAFAIANGSDTAAIMKAAGDSFAGLIRAATGR